MNKELKNDLLPTTSIDETLKQMIARYGSQKECAEAIGISEQYLSDILKGRRDYSEKVALALGYQRKIIYLKMMEIYGK